MQRSTEVSGPVARSLGTFESGDTSTFESLVSREGDLLGIGTDPDEWWPGRDNLLRAANAQIPEMHGAGMRFRIDSEQSFSDGEVGWSGAQTALVLPDGTAVPMRFTSVWRQEAGDWKLVQFHVSVGVSNEQLLGQELTV